MKIKIEPSDTEYDLVEAGVGLIARGLYRMRELRSAEAAAIEAGGVVSHFTATHLDLLRAAKEKVE